LLNYIGGADALLHVVRAFEDSSVPHPDETVDPQRDIEAVDLELTFSDLAIIERRLQRLNSDIAKMSNKDRELRTAERDVLVRLQGELESGKPIRSVTMSDEEAKLLRGYQFLTAKPLLLVINVGEDQIHTAPDRFTTQHKEVVVLAGKIEAELAQLEDDDAVVFMDDLGITSPARNRVIASSYRLLGLMSFLTAGPDEVRAWTIRQQTPAAEAAGTIHSDIQRGFIRAEIVAFDDLMRAGSMTEAKKQGTVRMEGKTYIVKDGDICNFLFNV
jgi:hypothetical protein